jgi:hypothetical protein
MKTLATTKDPQQASINIDQPQVLGFNKLVSHKLFTLALLSSLGFANPSRIASHKYMARKL